MKKFAGHKSSKEIIAQCAAQGIAINTEKYDAGGDHLVVALAGPEGAPVNVLYNVVNGRFFSAPAKGQGFDSDQLLDAEPWFAAMLEFFYTETIEQNPA